MNIKLTSFSIFLILLFVLVISSICWNCFMIEPLTLEADEIIADAAADTAEAEAKRAELIAAGVPETAVTATAAQSVGAKTIKLDNPSLNPGDIIVVDGKSYKISSNAITT